METPPVTSKKTLVKSLSKSSLTPCRRLGLCRPRSSSLNKSLNLRTLNSTVTSETKAETLASKVLESNDKTQDLDCDNRLKTPLKSSDVLNKTVNSKVRRCLRIGQTTPSLSEVKCLPKNRHTSHNLKSDFGNCLDGASIIKSGNTTSKLDYTFNHETSEESNQTSKGQTGFNPVTLNESSLVSDETGNTQEISSEMIQQLMLSIKEKKKKLELLKVQETYAKKHNLDDLRAQTSLWRTAGQEALRHTLSLLRQTGYSVSLTELMSQHGFPPQLMNYSAEDDEFT